MTRTYPSYASWAQTQIGRGKLSDFPNPDEKPPEPSQEPKFEVYALGLCYASVCAPKDMPREEVEMRTQWAAPTGIGEGWKVADEPFSGGEANPHDRSCGRHWLLVC